MQGMLRPVAMCAVLSLGCATSYSPREPGRISFLMSSRGEDVLEKDGKTYRIGGFSDGLAEAVSGNPTAEKHAHAYVHHQRLSYGLAVATTVVLMVGVLLLAVSMAEPVGSVAAKDDHDHRASFQIASGIAGIIGLAALTGAAINGEAAQSNLYDAINIYNDGASRR